MSEPIVKLDPGGKAPIVSYNVPDRTAYDGRHVIELKLPPLNPDDPDAPHDYFAAPKQPNAAARAPIADKSLQEIEEKVREALQTGVYDRTYFPNIATATNALRVLAPTSVFGKAEQAPEAARVAVQPSSAPLLASVGLAIPVSNHLANLEPRAVAQRLKLGERLNIYRTLHGSFTYNFIPEPPPARPRLLLIETYRLSSFLGNYGAGRTLSTFSLLPGEKTTITIKTYTKTETERKEAQSVLESASHESTEDFENSVQKEQSDKQNQAESFEYHAEADAHASWGWGSANISGGVKGGSNSSREDFTKNVSNALDKHAAKASSKRDVQIDTSKQSKVEAGTETSTVRELQNINVGRTLNFVFRQMNQEFVSILHLVDVRLGFFDGFAESRREVSLHDMDGLLDEVLVDDPAIKQSVREAIRGELETIFDYQDEVQSIVESRDLPGGGSYLRVRKNDFETTVTVDGKDIAVLGIPVRVDTRVMRTEGVIVEALLGQGNALDPYSMSLQEEAVRAKVLENKALEDVAAQALLGRTVVSTGTVAQADGFQKIFFPPPVDDND